MSFLAVCIKELSPHPESSKLKIAKVFDGKKTTQVVCAAQNIRQGMITILAPVGAKLPSGLSIQKTQLRGIDSEGMLCSAKDLALSLEGGIVDLPEETPLGSPISAIDPNLLSSTPWYKYLWVESLWLAPDGNIIINKEKERPLKNGHKVLGQTYYWQGEYLYRHYPLS